VEVGAEVREGEDPPRPSMSSTTATTGTLGALALFFNGVCAFVFACCWVFVCVCVCVFALSAVAVAVGAEADAEEARWGVLLDPCPCPCACVCVCLAPCLSWRGLERGEPDSADADAEAAEAADWGSAEALAALSTLRLRSAVSRFTQGAALTRSTLAQMPSL
jgi:hypothetical protein